ncbi:MAG: hypothetical protein ACTMIA_11030 [Vibrio sp.]
MFGIKKMKHQRDTLYRQTKQLEQLASVSRTKAKDSALHTASSPPGLLVSFIMGATTQTDLAKHARRNLLSRATRDVFSFLSAQLIAGMSESTPAQPPSEPTPEMSSE